MKKDGLHVIHSCASRSFSGLEQYVLDLAVWQHRQGHSVELYCREHTELCRRAEAAGVPVWKIGEHERAGPRLWSRTFPQWKQRLARLAPGEKIVLHMHAGGEPRFHFPWIARPGRWGGRVAKVILHLHLWIDHRKHDPWHWFLFKLIDELWTSSESARSHYARIFPLPTSKIRVVPYGRDVVALRGAAAERDKHRAHWRGKFGVGEGETLGVCVSRIETIKGVRELFDAFVEVASRHPQAHLAIIGDATPNDPAAKTLADELKARHAALAPALGRRLHLPGYLPGVDTLLVAADYYVLPSYMECMSLAMQDALIVGLPVLGTDAGGTPSMVRPGQTGWLVPPADTKALARALEEVLARPEAWAALGQNAQKLGEGLEKQGLFRKIWASYR